MPAIADRGIAVEHFPERAGSIAGLVVIEVRRVPTCYRVTEIEPQQPFRGRGFSLEKIWGGTDRSVPGYWTFVSEPGTAGGQDSCECRGYYRHHHCKHIEAMRRIAYGGRE